jgi:hypothetical protein
LLLGRHSIKLFDGLRLATRGKMFNFSNSWGFARPCCVVAVAIFVAPITGSVRADPAEQTTPRVGSLTPDPNLFFALGMIESGNDDRGVGQAGEVSRFQILPSVWKSYSESRDYQNPEVSFDVVRRHWKYLINYFRNKAGREPTAFDMYVLWNTRFGHYARRSFDPACLSPVVRNRASRFVNLVNR